MRDPFKIAYPASADHKSSFKSQGDSLWRIDGFNNQLSERPVSADFIVEHNVD
jgi:hypothetical protein